MSDPDKRIAILGAGESGVGAALLAKAKGFAPFVSDAGKIKPDYKATLLKNSISVEEGKHTEHILLSADEVIKSPGISEQVPIVQKLRERNIPVISEIEFAARYTSSRIIAVTGTNGKSTTTYLIYHLMKEAGLRVCMAGNVGNSFAREVLQNNYDYYVLEISSFQLDGMFRFKADISILLNITPDHLDRYDHDMDRYTASKFRILQNQKAEDKFIFFADDATIRTRMNNLDIPPEKVGVSLSEKNVPGACQENDKLVFRFSDPSFPGFNLDINELPVQGPHNMVNLMSAVMAVSFAGVNLPAIRQGLKSFINFPHRMEKVGVFEGVLWVNDSKATNIDSAKFALDSYAQPIVWIVGGVDKGNDYELIRPLVHRKVKAIIALGKDNSRIVGSFKNDVERIEDMDDMKKAVRRASQLADPGDVVLLSPACASFDLFRNYIDRGDQFREAVKELEVKNTIKT